MAKLTQYTANLEPAGAGGGRRATSEDFGGGIGEAGQALGRSALAAGKQIVADIEEQDQRDLLVKHAEIRAKYNQRADEAVNTGEDLQKIQQDFENEVGEIRNSARTTRGLSTADLHHMNSRSLLTGKLNDISVARATVEARTEGGKFLNAQGALVASNPSYLPIAEQETDAFVATLSKLSSEKRAAISADLKQSLNMGAALSLGRMEPEQTMKMLKDGQFNLTPENRAQAIGAAQSELNARRAAENHARALSEFEARKANDAARDKHFGLIISGEGGSQKIKNDIMADQSLLPQTREHLIILMEARAKEMKGQEKVSDASTYMDLWLKINAPDGFPGKIYDIFPVIAAVQNQMKGEAGINTTDADRLRAMIANQRDPNNSTIAQRTHLATSAFGRAVANNPRYLNDSGLQASMQVEYTVRITKRMDDLRSAGKNPTEVFDPESKDYIGSAQFMNQVMTEVSERDYKTRLPQVKGDDDPVYNSLPPGATYVNPRGEIAKKGKAAPVAAPVFEEINGVKIAPAQRRGEMTRSRVERANPRNVREMPSNYDARINKLLDQMEQ